MMVEKEGEFYEKKKFNDYNNDNTYFYKLCEYNKFWINFFIKYYSIFLLFFDKNSIKILP